MEARVAWNSGIKNSLAVLQKNEEYKREYISLKKDKSKDKYAKDKRKDKKPKAKNPTK